MESQKHLEVCLLSYNAPSHHLQPKVYLKALLQGMELLSFFTCDPSFALYPDFSHFKDKDN